METKVEYFLHNLNEEDIASAREVMGSVFLTTGPMVARFEKNFAQYMNAPEAVGVTSCTGAMHLALLRCGIGPGDEVITTPMTFAATTTAILQARAQPVFVDVCPKSGLLRPEDAATAITPRTKAVMPVHLYGRMVDMRGFADLADQHDLFIIEDAAHAIEAERDGIRPGQLAHAACFSFYPTKSMTCGEGGALVCRTEEDAAWYRSARHHGITKNAAERYTKGYRHWDMDFLGWKYNLDDIKAAMLIPQIDRLDEYNRRRSELETLYRNQLAYANGLDFIEPLGPGEKSGHHLFTVLMPKNRSRDEIITELQAAGIGCAVNYRAVHTLKYFRETFGYKPEDFPAANDIGNRTISLPLYPKLKEHQVTYVTDTLKKLLG